MYSKISRRHNITNKIYQNQNIIATKISIKKTFPYILNQTFNLYNKSCAIRHMDKETKSALFSNKNMEYYLFFSRHSFASSRTNNVVEGWYAWYRAFISTLETFNHVTAALKCITMNVWFNENNVCSEPNVNWERWRGIQSKEKRR